MRCAVSGLALALALDALFAAGCRTHLQGSAKDAAPRSRTAAGVRHAIVGAWTLPRDGKPGFRRVFRPDGTVTVWWPDGRVAAESRFEVIDAQTVSVKYANGDTDVVRLIEPDAIRIERVEYNGYHWKYYARRVESDGRSAP